MVSQSPINMNYDQIWEIVLKDTTVNKNSIHGPSHWARVERNGLYIAKRNGADQRVTRLFAVFHDCMRLSDGNDPEHGKRAKHYILTIAEKLISLERNALERLCYACKWHTHEIHHDDITISTCWDSDRLDLPRVNITPKPEYLNTDAAIGLAIRNNYNDLNSEELRQVGPLHV